MKKLLSTSVFCLLTVVFHAQITTNEQPLGLSLIFQNRALVQLPKPDMEKIYAEDAANDEINNFIYIAGVEGKSDADGLQPIPLRFSYGVPVNFTLTNSGTWYDLTNGDKLWQLKVHIQDALSLNAYYEEFYLPEGAKFFVYSEETRQSIGAITSEFLEGSFDAPIKFVTGEIYGENMVFEFWQPSAVQESAVISISHISYGYRFINNSMRDVGDADKCHININCPPGNPYQNHKRAVARVIIRDASGSRYNCTGSLINNTNNDLTPYFLTANHCLKGQDAINNPDASPMGL